MYSCILRLLRETCIVIIHIFLPIYIYLQTYSTRAYITIYDIVLLSRVEFL